MLYSRLKTQAGFTLVEALISLVIIAIAAAGILTSFVAAKQFIEHSGRRQISSNLVRQEMERLVAAVRQDTWDSGSLKITDIDPLRNNCADKSSLYPNNAAGDDWTDWVALPGELGGSVWQGKSRRCVTEVPGSGNYRMVMTELGWRAAD